MSEEQTTDERIADALERIATTLETHEPTPVWQRPDASSVPVSEVVIRKDNGQIVKPHGDS